MNSRVAIRPSSTGDIPAIMTLYREAFPKEDLGPLVTDLLRIEDAVLSLVGFAGASVAGHIAFTRCSVEGSSEPVSLLGPLAVAPQAQRQGLGSALVREGLGRLTNQGVTRVIVLGGPSYYARFGFVPEPRIIPPFPLAPEWRTAWQSLPLGAAHSPCEGRLCLPAAWLRPALWAP